MSDEQNDRIYVPIAMNTLYYNRILYYINTGKWKNINEFVIEAIIDKLLEIEGEEK